MDKKTVTEGLEAYQDALAEVDVKKKFNITIQLKTITMKLSPENTRLMLVNFVTFLKKYPSDQQFDVGVNAVEDNPFNETFGEMVQAKIKARQIKDKLNATQTEPAEKIKPARESKKAAKKS